MGELAFDAPSLAFTALQGSSHAASLEGIAIDGETSPGMEITVQLPK